MAIIWTDSTDKHGVDPEDAVYAMQNRYLHLEGFDEPRRPGASRPDLFIGPPRTLGGPLLEIMVERVPPRDLIVFHAMEARPQFLALLEQEGD